MFQNYQYKVKKNKILLLIIKNIFIYIYIYNKNIYNYTNLRFVNFTKYILEYLQNKSVKFGKDNVFVSI